MLLLGGHDAAQTPAMSEPEVFIHAGAHRTGTSSFQLCLAHNRSVLQAAGFALAYPGRDDIPGGTLALRLPGPRHGATSYPTFVDKACVTLRDASMEARGLILSEENIPGRMLHFHQGAFFPATRARASVLHRALPGPLRHLVYVVRPYDALFASAFRKRAEDNAVGDFADNFTHYLNMAQGWPEVVATLKAQLAPEKMTVIAYSARGRSEDLLRVLVPGLAQTSLQEPTQSVNLSATDAALEALQARYRAGEKLGRAQWQDVIAAHRDQSEDRGFTRYPSEVRSALRDRYARDAGRLAGMPDINFVS